MGVPAISFFDDVSSRQTKMRNRRGLNWRQKLKFPQPLCKQTTLCKTKSMQVVRSGTSEGTWNHRTASTWNVFSTWNHGPQLMTAERGNKLVMMSLEMPRCAIGQQTFTKYFRFATICKMSATDCKQGGVSHMVGNIHLN